MNTTYKHEQKVKQIKEQLVAQEIIKAHPSKKHLVFIDGDIHNTKLNNLAWSTTTPYGWGVMTGQDAQAGVFELNLVEKKNMEHMLTIGAYVMAGTTTYPDTKDATLAWNIERRP